MQTPNSSIYTTRGNRKYLTVEERQAFVTKLQTLSAHDRLFCLTLLFTGCRLSEALSLTREHISISERIIVFRTLKQRGRISMRHMPVPVEFLDALSTLDTPQDGRLFPWGRTRGWKVIKQAMTNAGLRGAKATPRGLRHTFGVMSVMNDIPLNMISKWMGHSNINNTAIYTDVTGNAEWEMAARTWCGISIR